MILEPCCYFSPFCAIRGTCFVLVGFHGLLSDVYLYPMQCKCSVKVGSVGKVGTSFSFSYAASPRVQVGYFARVSVFILSVPQRKNLYLFFGVLQLCEVFQGAAGSI